MEKKESFEDVKVGDKIFFTSGYGYNFQEYIGTITKVTDKQFAVNNIRFRKEDGKEIGQSYSYCRRATEQDIIRLKKAKIIEGMRGTIRNFFAYYNNVDYLSFAELETICAIIKKHTNNNG